MESLGPLPAGFARTRDALHRLAEDVMSPAQAAVNGDIHFDATPGGFGTPVFGDGRQLRVEGVDLVEVDGGAEVRREPVAGIDAGAARWLAALFALGDAVLRELIADAPDAEPIRLWPEHFDIATVIDRATYGVSPGDEHHDEPYLYVAPWDPVEGEPWNARGFTGAELSAPGLDGAVALDFFRRHRAALTKERNAHV